MAYIFLIFSFLVLSNQAEANNCCGQSPASFTVLSQDQRLSLSAGFSYLRSQGRVYANSNEFFIWGDKKRDVRSLLLNIASVVSGRHQVFLNTAFMEGQYVDQLESGRSTNQADTLVGYSYEVLPEYNFSYWKPLVYLTAFVNLPTGNSIYEEGTLSEGADVTGHNQWGVGIGLTAIKTYYPFTVTLQARTIRLFAREFSTVEVSDFYDSSLALLGNYVSRLWGLSFSSGITFNHLSERRLLPSGVTSDVTQNFTVLAGIQRPISNSLNLGINYADQTLIGPAKNSILNRSITINFNYNYL